MSKKIITLGEVMMRLATTDKERFSNAHHYKVYYGGAEANVAVSLAHLGQKTSHITIFPNNELGKGAISYLRSHGVDTSYIQFSDHGRMGLYFFENGYMQRPSRIVYDRFGSSFSTVKTTDFDWDTIFKDADWLHWTGITPAISDAAADFCSTAIMKAKQYGLTISGDINYRRNLWQYGKKPLDIMPGLIENTHVVIAGLTDFENCMGIKTNQYETACRQAKEQFPNITTMATTHRTTVSASHNELSAILWNNDNSYHSKHYEMPTIVDRIGGGDAFMAGLIYGLLYEPPPQALEFAVAASVLKHAIPGDANLVTTAEIMSLANGDNTGKLLR